MSWQVETGSYDLDANLAVLRHYNFSPEQANITTTAKILILAQMRLPEHDFSQMLHLIPERVQVRISRMDHACVTSWRHWQATACVHTCSCQGSSVWLGQRRRSSRWRR